MFLNKIEKEFEQAKAARNFQLKEERLKAILQWLPASSVAWRGKIQFELNAVASEIKKQMSEKQPVEVFGEEEPLMFYMEI